MIGSKGVAKSVFHTRNTIEFWGLWEQLNNPNFKGANSAPLGMEQEQMHYPTPKESSKKCLTSL